MSSFYAFRLSALKSRYGAALNRRYQLRRLGERAGWRAENWIRWAAPGKSFLDVGGMWGIHGEHSFAALRDGATSATLIDLYSTPEFQARVADAETAPSFIEGEADHPDVVAAAGPHEVVWCWGVICVFTPNWRRAPPRRLVSKACRSRSGRCGRYTAACGTPGTVAHVKKE